MERRLGITATARYPTYMSRIPDLSGPKQPIEDGVVANLLEPLAYPDVKASALAELEREVAMANQSKRSSAVMAPFHLSPLGDVLERKAADRRVPRGKTRRRWPVQVALNHCVSNFVC
jgi:hypothetical protein